MKTLPITDELNTVPDWRANIRLRSTTTAVSYQGDYPDKIVALARSNSISISPMLQDGAGILNKLIFVNLLAAPDRRPEELLQVRLRDRQVMARHPVRTNSCTVIELPPAEPGEASYWMTPNVTGIPLYLSHDRDFKAMSMEHTHGPHEFLYGEKLDKFRVIRSMKKYWSSVG